MANKTKRPTEAQMSVLRKMRDGWELGLSDRLRGGCRIWLQQGGCGMGGNTQRVTTPTFGAVRDAGWIERAKSDFPTTTYRLTNAGRAALEQP